MKDLLPKFSSGAADSAAADLKLKDLPWLAGLQLQNENTKITVYKYCSLPKLQTSHRCALAPRWHLVLSRW
jgi:hypothetical protein